MIFFWFCNFDLLFNKNNTRERKKRKDGKKQFIRLVDTATSLIESIVVCEADVTIFFFLPYFLSDSFCKKYPDKLRSFQIIPKIRDLTKITNSTCVNNSVFVLVMAITFRSLPLSDDFPLFH